MIIDNLKTYIEGEKPWPKNNGAIYPYALIMNDDEFVDFIEWMREYGSERYSSLVDDYVNKRKKEEVESLLKLFNDDPSTLSADCYINICGQSYKISVEKLHRA